MHDIIDAILSGTFFSIPLKKRRVIRHPTYDSAIVFSPSTKGVEIYFVPRGYFVEGSTNSFINTGILPEYSVLLARVYCYPSFENGVLVRIKVFSSSFLQLDRGNEHIVVDNYAMGNTDSPDYVLRSNIKYAVSSFYEVLHNDLLGSIVCVNNGYKSIVDLYPLFPPVQLRYVIDPNYNLSDEITSEFLPSTFVIAPSDTDSGVFLNLSEVTLFVEEGNPNRTKFVLTRHVLKSIENHYLRSQMDDRALDSFTTMVSLMFVSNNVLVPKYSNTVQSSLRILLNEGIKVNSIGPRVYKENSENI